MKLKKIGLNLKKTKKTLLLEFISQSISKESKLSPLSDETLKKMFEQKKKLKNVGENCPVAKSLHPDINRVKTFNF